MLFIAESSYGWIIRCGCWNRRVKDFSTNKLCCLEFFSSRFLINQLKKLKHVSIGPSKKSAGIELLIRILSRKEENVSRVIIYLKMQRSPITWICNIFPPQSAIFRVYTYEVVNQKVNELHELLRITKLRRIVCLIIKIIIICTDSYSDLLLRMLHEWKYKSYENFPDYIWNVEYK